MTGDIRNETVYALWVDPEDDVTAWGPVRDLTDAEARQARHSSTLVASATVGSAFETLSQYQDDLHEAIDNLAKQVANRDRGTAAAVERVRRRFADFLGAFTAFLARTRRFAHVNFDAPVDGTLYVEDCESREYGRNLAYRLATQLRNLSLHERDTFNDWKLTETDVDTFEVDLRVDCRALAESSTFKLNAKVKSEMVEHTSGVPILGFAHELMLSCERIHSNVLLSLRTSLHEAIRVLEEMRAEVLRLQRGSSPYIGPRGLSDVLGEPVIAIKAELAPLVAQDVVDARIAVDRELAITTFETLEEYPALRFVKMDDGLLHLDPSTWQTTTEILTTRGKIRASQSPV